MARFGSLGTQYFDNSGEPLIDGLIYFYESGTTTLKDTFSDEDETIPNTNPVELSAAGRQPNVFFTGPAKAVLATSADVIIETRDPVGVTSQSPAFAEWDPLTTYGVGEIVTGSDGNYYVSIVSPNLDFDPVTEREYWTQIEFIRIWNEDELYQPNDIVKGSNGVLYRGVSVDNEGNNPVGAPNEDDWIAFGDVTRTGTQTLTNKTIVDPILTLDGDQGNAGDVPYSQGAGQPPEWAPAPVPGALIFIAERMATASAAVDFSALLDSTYDVYVVKGSGITLSGNSSVKLQVEIGGSWVTTSTYDSAASQVISGGASVVHLDQEDATNFDITFSTPTNEPAAFSLEIYNPSNTTHRKVIIATSGGMNTAADVQTIVVSGSNQGTGAVTGLRFSTFGAPNMTGAFRLYGVNKA